MERLTESSMKKAVMEQKTEVFLTDRKHFYKIKGRSDAYEHKDD